MEENVRTFLGETHFNAEQYYSVVVSSEGVTVFSECCGDTMSPEVARQVRDAIDEYLAILGTVASPQG